MHDLYIAEICTVHVQILFNNKKLICRRQRAMLRVAGILLSLTSFEITPLSGTGAVRHYSYASILYCFLDTDVE